MSTTVKTFQSSQAILPALSGQAGALKTILKTCLVDGAGAQTVTISVASGVATVTFPTAHGMLTDGILLVAGATPAALNGEQRITVVVNSTTLKFNTTAVDGAATGTITAKLAPAGWSELFTGTNLTVLKPTAVEATGCVLRVDDTGTTTARVRGFASMTDVSTGIGPFPEESQVSGGLYWMKSGSADATARPWILVADERGFYFCVLPSGGSFYTVYWAGDVASLKSGDAWSFMLAGDVADRTAATSTPDGCMGYGGRSARAGAYMPRASAGLGGSVQVQRIGQAQNGATTDVYSGASGYSMAGDGPNPANNGLLLTPLELIVNGSRGVAPGLYHARNNWAATFASGTIVDGTDDLAGRRLLALRVGPAVGSLQTGTVFIDLTGPWSR